MAGKWTRKWPKKEGYYWFYGLSTTGARMGQQPSLYLVKVKAVTGNYGRRAFAYIAEGRFIGEEETKAALWKPAELPEVPGIKELMEGT